MSLALKARQKVRRKGGGKERVFGCDLLEHLQQSGQDVPQVLRSCTEFVEQHGVVDGIYRLSGVSSNIQRLRQEFDSDRCPDLQKDVYLQDIHCVSSLCKAYFRELPNPLLTYQLYDKFAVSVPPPPPGPPAARYRGRRRSSRRPCPRQDAVAIQMEEARLVKIKEVLKELPVPHYRTLEFLMRHLLLMASYSSQTNMHARNLAIVWAPNLLRSKDIEATGFNGTAAFMEVRVQSIVVEFILTHVEQLFGDAPLRGSESPRRSLLLGGGSPRDGQPPPYHVPATLSQGDGPPPIRPYHTIIELNDHRRKGSLKAKKWRSIFNLGRSSHEAKRKLVKAEEKDDKCGKITLRPAKSMDSLSSVPFASDDDPQLSKKRSVRQPPQRRDSFDACSSLPAPESCPELEESLEEKLKGKEEPRGPESEGESSTKSEPTTPKASRASLVAPGRSPKAAHSRAEKCAGVHISGPFSVTVPFHITSNLSRLTRGLPCPALAQAAAGREPPASPPPPARHSTGDPEAPEHRTGEGTAAVEETRLSLELRDSFAFLDSQETWLEGGGDGEPAAQSLLLDTGPGDGEGFLAIEEGMESGFMNLGEPPAEQPGSYLSIEECMDEEMFFMAPSGSDAEDCASDTDSDDMFLSAHDDLSPLAASLEPLDQPLGEGEAPQEPGEAPQEPAEPPVPASNSGVVPEALGVGGPGSSSGSPSLSASAPDLSSITPTAPELSGVTPAAPEPSQAEPTSSELVCREPVAVLRRDGSAPVRLAARTIRVQQARSVPVVPPKPQFARIPPALQPWAPAAEGDATTSPRRLPSPPVPEGPPHQSVGARRAGWREGGSVSCDEAVAAAAEQQLAQAPARKVQPSGEGEPAPAAPKTLPFHQGPLRPRLLRPLSCVAAPEGEATGRNRLGPARPTAQAEGAALPPPRRPVGTKGVAGER
ncbi:rho GTPase-activating protein 30 [Grus japonensis]|uniref:Rho GTPase-activating protein 30 n=1 Tax=Grus japonensis TaxID=30415 RepID=A0ABC9XTQ0_GRUJA